MKQRGENVGKWPCGLLLVEPHDHQDYYNLPAFGTNQTITFQTKNSKKKLLVNPSAFPENLAAWPVMKLGKPPTIPGVVLTYSHFTLLPSITIFKAFPASNIRSLWLMSPFAGKLRLSQIFHPSDRSSWRLSLFRLDSPQHQTREKQENHNKTTLSLSLSDVII